MILRNGVVRTLDPSLPTSASLAVAGDLIAGGVGVHETALASPETVDLGGRCVLPGFTDSHVHFPTWAVARREVALDGAGSLEEVLARIGAAVGGLPEGRWLLGHGWRSGDWAGERERDDTGEPTGILREESAWRFKGRYVHIAEDEYVEAMREGVRVANARGVTCVHDKDGWLGAAGLWQRLEERGSLSLRVWQSLPHDRLPELRDLALRGGLGSPLLRLGYLKVFMDGTLGSQTAWMLDGSGVRITSGEDLEQIVRDGATAGWPVGVHAIGDAANRAALDAFERTREVWQPLGLRQRIEHAQCLAPEDVSRFGELGVAASVQFSHAPSDEHLARRFWADRLQGTYSFRSLLEAGALLANGSDAPIEELDPWAGVVAGVVGHWREDQRLTLQDALSATCVAPAWLSHDERVRGTLLPGRLADLVVLDRDPFGCEPGELSEVRVVATMVSGRWVFNPPPWD